MQINKMMRDGLEEFFLTAVPYNSHGFERVFPNIHTLIEKTGAKIVTMDVFGIPSQEEEGLEAMRKSWPKVDWPVTWLDEGPTAGLDLTGVQVHAIRGADIQRIPANGRVVGSMIEDEYARHCYLGDLWTGDEKTPRDVQAKQTFELMESVLHQVDMTFDNVVRTWLYLDRILDWYDVLNRVRNEFFRAHGTFDKIVPASTGIGGANSARRAIIADTYAVVPLHPEVKITMVPSPLQCPALEYGSSFSRAIEVDMPDHRTLWVSGTASIEPGGKTAYVGDMAKQVQLTMDVVEAILLSRGMGWHDVTRGVAYVKHAADAPAFRAFCKANRLPAMPFVVTENDVCRDDLLFEIEVDAIRV